MIKRIYLAGWFMLLPSHIFSIHSFAHGNKATRDFLIDVDRPFVYIKFDHIGPGAPRAEDEPTSRMWLRLRNNCRIPILVRANGLPDESPKDEIGLEYEVVRNPTKRGPILLIPSMSDKPEVVVGTEQQEAKPDEVPRGYIEEVASLVTIGPNTEILFSMPVNHLSERWHVEIPFEFDLPRGKCCRDPNNGGNPEMVVEYSLWDLPPNSQKAITRK